MTPEDFSDRHRQNLIQTIDGAWAFVPPPLPPEIDMSELALPLAAAATAIGELKGAARRLPNPYMLIGALQRREALTSSAMEGTITTLGDMVLEEAAAAPPKGDDAREAYNYVRAIEAAVETLRSIPISHRLIKQMHRILLGGLSPARGAGKRPGEYKVHQNAVGRKGDTIHSARYVPPPPQQSQTCMDQLEVFINRDGQTGPSRLIDLALAHYQFEAIHPFDDGNGRIGRMLVTLLAMQSGLLDLPLLHISAHLERDKDGYIERLFGVSTHGLWESWIAYFLHAVEASCNDATTIVDRILALQIRFRDRARQVGKNPRLLMIVDALFTKSWATVADVQKLCNVTYPTASADLSALAAGGLLRELRTLRPKVYYAPEILALSDRT